MKYHKQQIEYDTLDQNHIDRLQLDLIPENSKILEVGCASGYMAQYLRNTKSCHVYGIDPDATYELEASNKCDIFDCGMLNDIETLTRLKEYIEANGKFNVIFLSQVIEHMVNPQIVYDTARLLLSKDGLLIISTVNFCHWRSRLRLLKGIWHYVDYGMYDRTHVNFYSIKSFEDEVAKNGWKIDAARYYIDDFPPLFFLRYLDKVTVNAILRKLKMVNTSFGRWYLNKYKGFIAFQFVYRLKLDD
jgi:methionine biosynthesis protein MetW